MAFNVIWPSSFVREHLVRGILILVLFVAYKEKIGLKCQFLIEPKPKEPCKHQYDYGKSLLLFKGAMLLNLLITTKGEAEKTYAYVRKAFKVCT